MYLSSSDNTRRGLSYCNSAHGVVWGVLMWGLLSDALTCGRFISVSDALWWFLVHLCLWCVNPFPYLQEAAVSALSALCNEFYQGPAGEVDPVTQGEWITLSLFFKGPHQLQQQTTLRQLIHIVRPIPAVTPVFLNLEPHYRWMERLLPYI